MRKIEDLKQNEAIHCKTEEEAVAICELMHESGKEWRGGGSYEDNIKWNYYEENTCYFPYSNTFASLDYCIRNRHTIFTLSDFLFDPKRGDRVLVWNDDEKLKRERTFVTEIEGASSPYVYVIKGNEEKFLTNKEFLVMNYRNIEPLPKKEIVELTIQDISNGKGVGVDPKLIRIKE